MAQWGSFTLPLYSTIGTMINNKPILTPGNPTTKNGTCLSYANGLNNCSTQVLCQDMGCSSGYYDPSSCGCSVGTTRIPSCSGCVGTDCYSCYNYSCNIPCYTISPGSCQPGVVLSSSGTSPSNAQCVCSYPFTPPNITKLLALDLPNQFLVGMIKRYLVSLYIDAWNSEIYGKVDSTFHKLDITDEIDYRAFRDLLLVKSGIQGLLGRFPEIGSELIELLESVTQLPSLKDLETLVFYLYQPSSWSGLTISQTPSSSELTSLLQVFTGENVPTSSYSPEVGNPTPISWPPTRDPGPYIILDLTNYKFTIGSLPVGNDYYIIGRVYTLPVVRLSPILVYFSRTNIPLTSSTCPIITKGTNQLPMACYNSECLPTPPPKDCVSYIINRCAGSTLQTNLPRESNILWNISKYLVLPESSACDCYNTNLPPTVISDSMRLAGMCFTGSCASNQSIIESFGLTDEYCRGYCGDVYDWLTSKDPSKRSQLPNVLDVQRYQKLCGRYTPTERKFNYYILGGGLLLSIIVSFSIYLPTKKWLLAIGVGLILSGLSSFLSYDLNGVPYCKGTTPSCQSKITHINIPNQLCSYSMGCECGIGLPQCPGVCTNGICIASLEPLRPSVLL